MRNKIEAIYPLSPMQQGMLFHALYASVPGEYIAQIVYRLEGELEVAHLKRAWQRVIDRHPVLRTAFFGKRSDKPLQVVLQRAELPFAEFDWRDKTDQEQQAALQVYIDEDRTLGFDISQAPLLRFRLIRLAENGYELIWTCHHLILDGWSISLVLAEVFTFYEAFCRGADLSLEPRPPYLAYVSWLQKQDLAKAEAFWRAALEGFTVPTPWPIRQRNRNGLAAESGFAAETTKLSAAATADLQSFVRQHQLTLNTVMQVAWALLLSRYRVEQEVLFGAVVSGRPPELAGVETMVGLFINTLPVRVRIRADQPLLDLLLRVQAQQVEAREFEYTPLTQIQEWSEVPRGSPLFESLFVFENYPLDASLRREQAGALKVTGVRAIERVNYPITLIAWLSGELYLKLGYDKRYFSEGTINRMLAHLTVLLEGFVAAPRQHCSALRLLTKSEEQQLLGQWNKPRTAAKTSCVHQSVEVQVERTPGAIALVFEHQSLTYRELDQRANKLAHFLRQRGVGPEVLVSVLLERSVDAIVALLGILKAGGAYLPLEQDYPSAGLAFMVDDAGARLILTQRRLLPSLPDHQAQTICLDADWELIDSQSDERPVNRTTPENLAYVIYTSGSTGEPKAVMVSHEALLNLAQAFVQLKNLAPGDKHMQFVSLSFDASGEEIYPTLMSGATLVLHRCPNRLSPLEMARFCEAQGVEILHLPPAFWHQFVDEMVLGKIPVPSSLRMFMTGGESLDLERVRTFAQLTHRRLRFLAAYGLSETTITATVYETIDGEEVTESARLPIGRPIHNVQVYVLDQELRPVPIGVPGEIFIAGTGLARGYLNRADLTAERFIPHPHSDEGGARLYRTGDLARHLGDGNLEFLGRRDLQIKLRGYRIELGHIEAVLLEHPGVRRAVVLVREEIPGEKLLVAYVMPAKPNLERDEVRRHLARKLPQHMIPSAFVMLDELPITPGGKVDKQALPAPLRTQSDQESNYVPPRTFVEEIIAGIWGEKMKVDLVGVHDNFFNLGGHSLLATQVVSRVRDTLGVEVPLRDLFEGPTVAELARRVEILLGCQPDKVLRPIAPVARDGPLQLSFAQQRLWFFDQLEPENPVYNIPVALRLVGPFLPAIFARSLRQIVGRHEVLRAAFALCEGQPIQVIKPHIEVSVPLIDLTELGQVERDAESHRLIGSESARPFDLTSPPLLRACVLRFKPEEHAVIMIMHHIVGDGWSAGVLVREINEMYAAFSDHREPSLPTLPIQYVDYASWQRAHLQSDVRDRQLAYWEQHLAGAGSLLELPTDRPRPAQQRFQGTEDRFTVSAELTRMLRTLSRQEGMTLFMTLLAAFQVLLFHYTGQVDLSVGTPVSGRDRTETEGLIGFFLNTLVLRTSLSGNPTFCQLLKRVRETCVAAYAHADLPFEMLVEKLKPRREVRHMPFFQVMFILHNAGRDFLNLPGLTVNLIETNNKTAKFDLVLEMVEGAETLGGSLRYDTDLFNASTIRRMVAYFETLLGELVEKPDQPLSKLRITSRDRTEFDISFGDNLDGTLENLSL